MSDFIEIPESLRFRRDDKDDLRLGERTAMPSAPCLLAGYPDDEGIELNGGRPGAKEAPNEIRRLLYRMTPPPEAEQDLPFLDIGNLNTQVELGERHEVLKRHIAKALGEGRRWLGLGGGHDYGYPDGAGFLEVYKSQKPLVLNFDAHLDVRPLDRGLSSGTPFYRLVEDYPAFDFAEIGIQNHCNSSKHREWCHKKGLRLLGLEDYIASGESLVEFVSKRLEDWLIKKRPTFISIDIDGFSSSHAMGCSQAWPTGFEPNSFFQLLEVLLGRLDVKVFGIYEVSPPLDQDSRTSKLAAQLAYRFLYSQRGN